MPKKYLPALLGIFSVLAACNVTGVNSSPAVTSPPKPHPQSIQWQGPLVISSGGTYTGNWQSLDPKQNAITINTSAPVILSNSNIQGRGRLIGVTGKVDLTILNSNFEGLNPLTKCAEQGRAVEADQDFFNFTFTNNTITGTRGILLQSHSGTGTLKVLYNIASNIDERLSDGSGSEAGYFGPTSISACGDPEQADNDDGTQDDGQFVQLNTVNGISGAEIGWNEITNEPGSSRVEDNISLYKSSGTSASHLNIHDNFIQGAFPIDPVHQGYSGGGIMAGDGGGQFITVDGNTVIQDTNYGIACSSGSDMLFSNNRTLQSGLLALPNQKSLAIKVTGDVGISPRNCSAVQLTNNTNLWNGTVSLAAELNEKSLWMARVKAAGVTLGPQ